MQTVNIDSNDFGEIRSRGYVYVDKTAWFHRLATAEGRKMFFLARPRRFGKSPMISTLEAMFQGKRELFEGFSANLPECMKHGLAGSGCKYDPKLTPEVNFGNAIATLAKKGTPPVILIDEYDDPVAGHGRRQLGRAPFSRGVRICYTTANHRGKYMAMAKEITREFA